MKRIYVVFEDDEFKSLKKAKGKASWHDFIVDRGLWVVKTITGDEKKVRGHNT
jgi:hypothetical protein